MTVESATFLSDLVSTNPNTNDPLAQGDDHIRLLKAVLKASFPLVTGALNASMVAFTPTGGLAATTVAGALAELDSEKYSSGGNLGTPSGGNLVNCTFPILNQNTTGSAASLAGFNFTVTGFAGNVNTLLTPGFYGIDSPSTNLPADTPSHFGHLLVMRRLDTYTQIFCEYSSGRMWMRSSVTTSFPAWKSVIDSGMIGSGLTFSGGVLAASGGASGVTSVGGYTGPAVTAGQVAAAASAGYGFNPATSFTSLSAYSTTTGGTYGPTITSYLRLTRHNGTYQDLAYHVYETPPSAPS